MNGEQDRMQYREERREAGASRSNGLPPPSQAHASCPWCWSLFTNIVVLLDHVDQWHLPPEPAAA
jgi:hypothetical protein